MPEPARPAGSADRRQRLARIRRRQASTVAARDTYAAANAAPVGYDSRDPSFANSGFHIVSSKADRITCPVVRFRWSLRRVGCAAQAGKEAVSKGVWGSSPGVGATARISGIGQCATLIAARGRTVTVQLLVSITRIVCGDGELWGCGALGGGGDL